MECYLGHTEPHFQPPPEQLSPCSWKARLERGWDEGNVESISKMRLSIPRLFVPYTFCEELEPSDWRPITGKHSQRRRGRIETLYLLLPHRWAYIRFDMGEKQWQKKPGWDSRSPNLGGLVPTTGTKQMWLLFFVQRRRTSFNFCSRLASLVWGKWGDQRSFFHYLPLFLILVRFLRSCFWPPQEKTRTIWFGSWQGGPNPISFIFIRVMQRFSEGFSGGGPSQQLSRSRGRSFERINQGRLTNCCFFGQGWSVSRYGPTTST